MPDKYQGIPRVLITEAVYQLHDIYESSERIRLNAVWEAVRLALMEDQSNENDSHSIDTDKDKNEPTMKMAWDYDNLKDSGRRGIPACRDNRVLCNTYNVHEVADLSGAHSNIGDVISSFPRIVKLTD